MERIYKANCIDLIYNNHEVFSLHDEDLGYCDHINQAILTSTEKLVYLLHMAIPRHVQGEVHGSLNT